MRTIVVITSRWSSKRLPGKALMKIRHKPLIRHIVDRARQATLIDGVVVATTLMSPSIINYCQINDIDYYAYENDWDVLGRLLKVADIHKADWLVYLWGDCPFIDPAKIDYGIKYFSLTQSYFFDMSQPMAIFPTRTLRDLDKVKLSRHKREYIHDYMYKNYCRPIIEINTKEDWEKANALL